MFLQNEHLRYKNYCNYNINMGSDFTLTYYSTDIFSPFESRHASFFDLRTRILISLSEGKQGLAEVHLVMIKTSFLFLWKLCNLRSGSVFVSLCKKHSGEQGETKRQPDTNLIRNVCAHFFDWLTFAESANQNYFRYLFFFSHSLT